MRDNIAVSLMEAWQNKYTSFVINYILILLWNIILSLLDIVGIIYFFNQYLKLKFIYFKNYLLQLVQKNKFDLLNINLICEVINRNCMSI